MKTLIKIFTTWLGVFPVLALVAWLLEPVLTEQALLIRMLVISAIMVPIIVVGVLPLMQWSATKFTNS